MNASPPPPPLVPPRDWLALAAVAVLLLAAGAWVGTARLPRMVDGRGVVLRDSEYGIYEIAAARGGMLAKVFVKEGDVVGAGQTVAEFREGAAPAVRAARAGRVIEVIFAPGAVTPPGRTLMRLESLSGPLEALVYVSALEGKKIRKGMEARLVPAAAPAEHGCLRARVSYVSAQPVTRSYLVSELGGNERLADWLAGPGSSTEVVLELAGDAAAVESGMLLDARIIFDHVRPLDWLFSPHRE